MSITLRLYNISKINWSDTQSSIAVFSYDSLSNLYISVSVLSKHRAVFLLLNCLEYLFNRETV